MTKADNSKRTFFKKLAAAAGFVSASGYLSNLMATSTNSIQTINENSEKDVIRQKKAWLQKQWVPMTDNDKKQMLDELLDIHNKSET
ncbi:hypothetical protein [Kaarinaea lacus]